MNENRSLPGFNRRSFLTGGVVVAGATLLGSQIAGASTKMAGSLVQAVTHPQKVLHLAATDGWVSMPAGSPPDLPFFPDSLAPTDRDTYVFGFRDVTGLTAAQAGHRRRRPALRHRSQPTLRRRLGPAAMTTLLRSTPATTRLIPLEIP